VDKPSDLVRVSDKSPAAAKVSDESPAEKPPAAECIKVSEKSSAVDPVPVKVVTDDDMPITVPAKPCAASSTPSGASSSHRSTVPKERASKSSKSARSLVTIKVFCARISKRFLPVKLPDFGNVTDKECMSTCKEEALINSDLRMWPKNDIHEVISLICELLSLRNNCLVDFVSGVVRSYWNNAKKKD